MRPHLTFVTHDSRGYSVIEVLLVTVMISVIAGFVVVSLVRANRKNDRTKSAVEIAHHLQKARLDSMRRKANEVTQMAQVTVFNRKFYSVAIDADNDGILDIPLVISLPERPGLEMSGPFPKAYIFDSLGQTVDYHLRPVEPPPMTVGDRSGASAIKFSEGKIMVVPAVLK